MSKPSAPEPPDPRLTSGLQTASNVNTALANAQLSNVNQVTPQGNLTYTSQDTGYRFTDPATGVQYSIPQFTATQTLSPNQQTIQNRNEQSQINLAGLAQEQSGRLQSLLGAPIDTSRAPAAADPNLLGNLLSPQTSFADAGNITRSFGPADNFSADRNRVEEALYGRLNPQLDRQRAQVEQQLADQGIRYGSPAYTAAMDNWSRQANDARLATIAAAGQEQQRLYEMAKGQAEFQNTAQQQTYGQALGRGNFYNAGAMMQAQQRQALLNAQNAARAQYLQEQYATRQEPINEITALLSGSQVSRPSFVSTPQTSIPTTDIAGLINQNFQQQFGNYQQQSNQSSQLLGGLLGLGSNLGAAARRYSDRRMKENVHKMGTVFAAKTDDNRMGEVLSDGGERKELPIYEYSYKDDPASTRHVGPMAQDVEKIDPGAVGKDRRGMRYIDRRRVMGSILRAA